MTRFDYTATERLFRLHKPADEETGKKLDHLREAAGNLADLSREYCPESPELTLAIRSLHIASMHAVSAVVMPQPGGTE